MLVALLVWQDLANGGFGLIWHHCGAGGDTECLALLAGMVWAVESVPVSAVVIGIIEVVLWRRRRRDRQPQDR